MARHLHDQDREADSVLNARQQSYMTATFRHVDELLSEVLHTLSAAEENSPFSRFIHDATPVQRKVVADYVARVRAAMRTLLESWRIDPSPHRVSAVWAARTALYMAQISVEELAPRYLRGYGEVPQEGVREMNAVVAELLDLLTQLESYLAQGSSRDLRARLERYAEQFRDTEVQALRELERMITAHGLTELRASLEALTDRLESHGVEVAVFGRVSCGKSSLLNYILKTDALPVGINPVTTFPLRIMYGVKPWCRAWFTDAIPELFDPGRLAEFATEQLNPSNRRHVTRIHVELPAPLLKESVVFVDTPGLGSLATSGAAESLAYLPRCDLGIVLVDAASTLTAEDVTLVEALQRTGAQVMVLVSKADLLSDGERARAVAYVADQLETRTGMPVRAHAVSVKGDHSALCDEWLKHVLYPVLKDHQRLARESLWRKIGLLRHTVMVALEKRFAMSEPPADQSKRGSEVAAILAQALAQIDEAIHRRPEEVSALARRTAEILDEVAYNAAAIWNQHQEPQTTIRELLEASLKSRANGAATLIIHDLIKLRAVLNSALAHAAGAAGASDAGEEDLPMPSGAPQIEAHAIIPPTTLRKPALAFIGTPVLRRSARRQLASGTLASDIGTALAQYGKQLLDWRRRVLSELRCAFVARRDLIYAQFDAGSATVGTAPFDRAALEEDIERLKRLEGMDTLEWRKVNQVA